MIARFNPSKKIGPAAGEHKVRPYLCTFAGKIGNLTVDLGGPGIDITLKL